MPRVGLTPKQSQLLGFLEAEIAAGRPVPTFDEMRRHMDLLSKSSIHRLLSALEERGRIVRLRHRNRAIALVAEGAATPPEPPPENRRLGVPKPVADQVVAYCDRRGLAPREILAAALLAYMQSHP